MQRWIFFLVLFLRAPMSYGLTDQGRDLASVLENGSLSEADCERYLAGQQDRETTLRCGKWQFFYGSLDRPGFPAELIEVFREKAPRHLGPSLEGFGFFTDPFREDKFPLGLAKAPDLAKGVASYFPSCALCHFGRLEDGRYVVGQPNHQLDFAGFVMTTTLAPELSLQPFKKLPPLTEAKLSSLFKEIFSEWKTRLKVASLIPRLLDFSKKTGRRSLTTGEMEAMSHWPRGVLDPVAYPSLDDEVTAPLRILPLWGIAREPMEAAGSTHGAMLTSAGGSPDIQHVIFSGAVITDATTGSELAKDSPGRFDKPLIAYIESLKPPQPEGALNIAQVEEGRQIFTQACTSCHNGPQYAGTAIYSFDEIGTDRNLAAIFDKDGDGKAVADIVQPYELTGGVRAPRLAGMWSMRRLLHNGSLRSLEELFCLNGPRPNVPGPGMSSAGHTMTCTDHSDAEKNALIAFLRSL